MAVTGWFQFLTMFQLRKHCVSFWERGLLFFWKCVISRKYLQNFCFKLSCNGEDGFAREMLAKPETLLQAIMWLGQSPFWWAQRMFMFPWEILHPKWEAVLSFFLTATRVVLKRFSNWGGQMLGFGGSQQHYYLNSNSQASGCGSYSCAWNTTETCGVFWVPCAN